MREAIQKAAEKVNTDTRRAVMEENRTLEKVFTNNFSSCVVITNTVKLSSLRHTKITVLLTVMHTETMMARMGSYIHFWTIL
jgi:hypothetical protein